MKNFENFLTTSTSQIPILDFIIGLVLTFLLSYLVGIIYEKYGNSISNRRDFGKNFVLLSMTTMVIITVVKSSLALSLGLVGALSIIRFRAAIKEPEELSYLFLVISIGLGFGANQIKITITAFIVITLAIILRKRFSKTLEFDNEVSLVVHSKKPSKLTLEEILGILNKSCAAVQLKRLDENLDMLEMNFNVQFSGFKELSQAKEAFKEVDESVSISFIDGRGDF
jgi:uncharacterized membrane protein YhiD involved in acid resistance